MYVVVNIWREEVHASKSLHLLSKGTYVRTYLSNDRVLLGRLSLHSWNIEYIEHNKLNLDIAFTE